MRESINAGTAIGRVSLSVRELARSLRFYQNQIGLELLNQEGRRAELGVGRRVLLELHEFPGAGHNPRATGLFHFALLVPSRLELARTLQNLFDTKTRIDGASDHHVSEALYLSDPDGHGIEIYRDRPRRDWTDGNGRFFMTTARLDLAGVMGELDGDPPAWTGIHPNTVMGHIHLQVSAVERASAFYVDLLGFDKMFDFPSASFLSAGGYHHHLGLNSWNSAGAGPAPANAARLLQYEIRLPDESSLSTVVDRLRANDVTLEMDEESWHLADLDGNGIRLVAEAA